MQSFLLSFLDSTVATSAAAGGGIQPACAGSEQTSGTSVFTTQSHVVFALIPMPHQNQFLFAGWVTPSH